MSADFTFRDFLMSEALIAEENVQSFDVDDPNAIANIKKAQRVDPTVSTRNAVQDANQKKQAANSDKTNTGRSGQLAKKAAAQQAMLAKTRADQAKDAKNAKAAR